MNRKRRQKTQKKKEEKKDGKKKRNKKEKEERKKMEEVGVKEVKKGVREGKGGWRGGGGRGRGGGVEKGRKEGNLSHLPKNFLKPLAFFLLSGEAGRLWLPPPPWVVRGGAPARSRCSVPFLSVSAVKTHHENHSNT